jgi:hypothetical protein
LLLIHQNFILILDLLEVRNFDFLIILKFVITLQVLLYFQDLIALDWLELKIVELLVAIFGSLDVLQVKLV